MFLNDLYILLIFLTIVICVLTILFFLNYYNQTKIYKQYLKNRKFKDYEKYFSIVFEGDLFNYSNHYCSDRYLWFFKNFKNKKEFKNIPIEAQKFFVKLYEKDKQKGKKEERFWQQAAITYYNNSSYWDDMTPFG
jgi:hypothetical protein